MNPTAPIACRLAPILASLLVVACGTSVDRPSGSRPGAGRSLSDVLVVDTLDAEASCANVGYSAVGGVDSPAASPNPAGAVRVDVFVFVVAIDEIDAITGSFRFEGYGGFIWCDPRLAFDASVEGVDHRMLRGQRVDRAFETMWWPGIFLPSQLGAPQRSNEALTVFSDGTVEFSAKFNTRMLASYDFSNFPFDGQTLSIPVQTYLRDSSSVDLQIARERVGLDHAFGLPEWWVRNSETRVDRDERKAGTFSRLVMDIHIRRKSGFYFWKIFLPIVIIVWISFSVFWMTRDVLAQRQRQSATGVLTLVAFQFVATGTLPRVPYLTVIDSIVLWSFVVSASTMVLNVINKRRFREDEALGLQYDRRCRWIYPTVYLAGLLLIGIRRYLF